MHRELIGCLQAGLIETRKHLPRVRNFELRVQVDLVVSGVNKLVETFTSVAVRAVGDNDQRVLRGEVIQLEASAVKVAGVNVGAVQSCTEQFWSNQVDEDVASLYARERDCCRALEGRGSPDVRQIKLYRVMVDLDSGCTLGAFGAGQIRGGHEVLSWVHRWALEGDFHRVSDTLP